MIIIYQWILSDSDFAEINTNPERSFAQKYFRAKSGFFDVDVFFTHFKKGIVVYSHCLEEAFLRTNHPKPESSWFSKLDSKAYTPSVGDVFELKDKFGQRTLHVCKHVGFQAV